MFIVIILDSTYVLATNPLVLTAAFYFGVLRCVVSLLHSNTLNECRLHLWGDWPHQSGHMWCGGGLETLWPITATKMGKRGNDMSWANGSWGPEKNPCKNSWLTLAQNKSYGLFPLLHLWADNSLTPSYTTDTLSSTASSLQHPPGPTNVILKNEAVCLPKTWNRQSYLLSPCARDAHNTQGVSETGTDEARCVSHPCCWNGTELQHLATFLLWKTSEKSHHKVIGYHLRVCISFIYTVYSRI